jgi:hypothetical protein
VSYAPVRFETRGDPKRAREILVAMAARLRATTPVVDDYGEGYFMVPEQEGEPAMQRATEALTAVAPDDHDQHVVIVDPET